MGCLYKVLAKVLANRLKGVMGSIKFNLIISISFYSREEDS